MLKVFFKRLQSSEQQTSIISNSMACHFSSFELPTNTMEKFMKWKNITIFHPHFPLQKNGLGSLHNTRVLRASLRNLGKSESHPKKSRWCLTIPCVSNMKVLGWKRPWQKPSHPNKPGKNKRQCLFFWLLASKSGEKHGHFDHELGWVGHPPLCGHPGIGILWRERGSCRAHPGRLMRSSFAHAPRPFSAFKLFGKAQQTSRPTSTRTVLTGVLRRKSHAVCFGCLGIWS